jgi:hypothetical protein
MGANVHSGIQAIRAFLSAGIVAMCAIQVFLGIAICCISLGSHDWGQENLDRDSGNQ